MTDAPPPPTTARPPAKARDRYLDTLRGIAIVRVVTYHGFGFAIFPWAPAMGVMFALAGTLMVRSVDKSAKQAVFSRFRRLLPVVWVFGAIWIPLMLWHDGPIASWFDPDTGGDVHPWQMVFWLLPVGDPPGSHWGQIAWGVLWYLKTYLWFVALSPLLLKGFRKAPWLVMAMPFALLLAAEFNILPLADWWGSSLNDVLTYMGCWLVGFAHAEGIIKRLPKPALFAIGGGVIAIGLAWLAFIANPEIVEAGGKPWTLEGSSLVLALYSFGVVFILMRFSSRMEWLKKAPVVDRIITILNSRAVTIYLWHNTALTLSMMLSDKVGIYPWYFWFPITWVLIGVAVLVFGPVEDIAARRKIEFIPGGKKKGAPATPAAAGGAAPPVSPAPSGGYGNPDSESTAALPVQGGYQDHRAGWPAQQPPPGQYDNRYPPSFDDRPGTYGRPQQPPPPQPQPRRHEEPAYQAHGGGRYPDDDYRRQDYDRRDYDRREYGARPQYEQAPYEQRGQYRQPEPDRREYDRRAPQQYPPNDYGSGAGAPPQRPAPAVYGSGRPYDGDSAPQGGTVYGGQPRTDRWDERDEPDDYRYPAPR